MLQEESVKDFSKNLYDNQKNENSTREFKKLMNYYLKYEYREQILDFLCRKYLPEDEIYDTLYLSINELKEMENEGNIVGAHTDNHKVLSRLSPVEQRVEIENSFLFLEKFLKMDMRSFCYPYGTEQTFNSDTLEILTNLNVHHAFMFNNSESIDKVDKYRLSRIDCNRF